MAEQFVTRRERREAERRAAEAEFEKLHVTAAQTGAQKTVPPLEESAQPVTEAELVEPPAFASRAERRAWLKKYKPEALLPTDAPPAQTRESDTQGPGAPAAHGRHEAQVAGPLAEAPAPNPVRAPAVFEAQQSARPVKQQASVPQTRSSQTPVQQPTTPQTRASQTPTPQTPAPQSWAPQHTTAPQKPDSHKQAPQTPGAVSYQPSAVGYPPAPTQVPRMEKLAGASAAEEIESALTEEPRKPVDETDLLARRQEKARKAPVVKPPNTHGIRIVSAESQWTSEQPAALGGPTTRAEARQYRAAQTHSDRTEDYRTAASLPHTVAIQSVDLGEEDDDDLITREEWPLPNAEGNAPATPMAARDVTHRDGEILVGERNLQLPYIILGIGGAIGLILIIVALFMLF